MELPDDLDIPMSTKDIESILKVAKLLRNLEIRNPGHPEFEEVLRFLATLIRKGGR